MEATKAINRANPNARLIHNQAVDSPHLLGQLPLLIPDGLLVNRGG